MDSIVSVGELQLLGYSTRTSLFYAVRYIKDMNTPSPNNFSKVEPPATTELAA
jgi:hypothetical protein